MYGTYIFKNIVSLIFSSIITQKKFYGPKLLKLSQPQHRLPWVVDLPNEINTLCLRDVKKKLNADLEQYTQEGCFINGRYVPPRKPGKGEQPERPKPLTKDEVETQAKLIERDPNSAYVNVEGVMRLDPAVKGHAHTRRHRRRRRRHHHQGTVRRRTIE